MKFLCRDEKETMALAKSVAEKLEQGDVLLLLGEMGSGKTAFARGLNEGLGCTDPASSPTFALMHCYGGGRLPLYHLDLYRLETCEEALDTGVGDITRDGVCAVEWPQVVLGIFPKDAIRVEIEALEDGTRAIEITNLKDVDTLVVPGA